MHSSQRGRFRERDLPMQILTNTGDGRSLFGSGIPYLMLIYPIAVVHNIFRQHMLDTTDTKMNYKLSCLISNLSLFLKFFILETGGRYTLFVNRSKTYNIAILQIFDIVSVLTVLNVKKKLFSIVTYKLTSVISNLYTFSY